MKSFLARCSGAHKSCMFCSHPRIKFTLQNSRFIKTVALKQEKGTAEDKEEELLESVAPAELHKEGISLEEMVDAQSYITPEQVN